MALMVDGVHFGAHCCVVALGIGLDGSKQPLAVLEGSTEDAPMVRALFAGLLERGPDVIKSALRGGA